MPMEFTDEFMAEIDALFERSVSFDELQALMQETIADALRLSSRGGTEEQILQAAVEQSTKLVEGFTSGMKREFAEVIAKGLEDNASGEEIARMLNEGMGLNSQQAAQLRGFTIETQKSGVTNRKATSLIQEKKEQLLSERADLIAREEMKRAVEVGAFTDATANGDTHKMWLAPGEDPCDTCLDNSDDGVIPIDEPFTSGDMTAQAHVNCYCQTVYGSDVELEQWGE